MAEPELGQRISVLGRAKNAALIDSVPVYEMQFAAAIESAISGRFSDWRLVRQPPAGDGPRIFKLSIEMQPGAVLSEKDRIRLWAAIVAQRVELEAVDVPTIIEIDGTPKLEQDKVQGDAKARRIVLDA